MCVYLRTKLQISSIILTSFRQGGYVYSPSPPSQPQNELLKSPPRLALTKLQSGDLQIYKQETRAF